MTDNILTDPNAIKTKHLYDAALWIVGISAAIICVILMYYERGDLGTIVFFIMVALALIIGAVGMKKALKVQYEADGTSKPILTEKSKKRNKLIYAMLIVYFIVLLLIAAYVIL